MGMKTEAAVDIATQTLSEMLNKRVVCETHEGAHIRGRLTKVITKTTRINGRPIETIERMEFNHDASEFIDWPLVESIYPDTTGG
jgi:hypothetical protein